MRVTRRAKCSLVNEVRSSETCFKIAVFPTLLCLGSRLVTASKASYLIGSPFLFRETLTKMKVLPPL